MRMKLTELRRIIGAEIERCIGEADARSGDGRSVVDPSETLEKTVEEKRAALGGIISDIVEKMLPNIETTEQRKHVEELTSRAIESLTASIITIASESESDG